MGKIRKGVRVDRAAEPIGKGGPQQGGKEKRITVTYRNK
jgi:hypothetical protein